MLVAMAGVSRSGDGDWGGTASVRARGHRGCDIHRGADVLAEGGARRGELGAIGRWRMSAGVKGSGTMEAKGGGGQRVHGLVGVSSVGGRSRAGGNSG